jgi:hypothetical protein
MTILSLWRLPPVGVNPFPDVNRRRFDRYASRFTARQKSNGLAVDKQNFVQIQCDGLVAPGCLHIEDSLQLGNVLEPDPSAHRQNQSFAGFVLDLQEHQNGIAIANARPFVNVFDCVDSLQSPVIWFANSRCFRETFREQRAHERTTRRKPRDATTKVAAGRRNRLPHQSVLTGQIGNSSIRAHG